MFQNAWVDSNRDSRNVAVQEFIINVENVADTPPIFISAPPVTRLPETSKIGDFVCNIVAVDGDKGLRRPIRYILDTRFIMKSSNFLNFFFLFQIQYICCLFQAWLHHWSSYCEKKFTRTGSRFGSRSSLAFENNSSGSSRRLLSSLLIWKWTLFRKLKQPVQFSQGKIVWLIKYLLLKLLSL